MDSSGRMEREERHILAHFYLLYNFFPPNREESISISNFFPPKSRKWREENLVRNGGKTGVHYDMAGKDTQ